ncbi:uncharacterized protein FOMMEDRAFT_158967 [Fomitiporia mediterranea MF3/22]|uniref:uncharacterized protein n=1 Tax=Fomitiporia mediterranea (strain MF3/22) TaxID=694068 RepID=UPI0004409A3D|nr:uncharacterized protein FOMMEDRAFT_158967 [Fomitiporia mediterranea MF3/22]EJD00297.1 hypothetical protein FOMMEDRAFT_158967 [Fomitiporia mediterranea MF3/22]
MNSGTIFLSPGLGGQERISTQNTVRLIFVEVAVALSQTSKSSGLSGTTLLQTSAWIQFLATDIVTDMRSLFASSRCIWIKYLWACVVHLKSAELFKREVDLTAPFAHTLYWHAPSGSSRPQSWAMIEAYSKLSKTNICSGVIYVNTAGNIKGGHLKLEQVFVVAKRVLPGSASRRLLGRLVHFYPAILLWRKRAQEGPRDLHSRLGLLISLGVMSNYIFHEPPIFTNSKLTARVLRLPCYSPHFWIEWTAVGDASLSHLESILGSNSIVVISATGFMDERSGSQFVVIRLSREITASLCERNFSRG